jgi:predicted amidohydrolase YtcJ
MSRTLLTSARLLDLAGADEEVRTTAATIVIDDGRIASVDVADHHDDTEADEVIDLANRVVLPGFVDSHVHLVWTGESLAKVALTDAGDLAEIQRRLGAARELLGDDATMLLGKGWLFDAVDGEPTAAMIDEVVSDIPVFLDSNDMHSVWVNSAALRVLGVDATTPDPPAGRISRLPSGEPAGMLYERAAHDIGWAYLTEAVGEDDLRASARRALDAFAAAGVTSVIDMGMDESGWRALQAVAADGGGTLPVRVAAHWAVVDSGDDDENLAQVERAARVAAEATEWLGVIGIKLVLDGVIDACTAAMSHPYTSGGSGDLMWDRARLETVAKAADAAGLRIAMHAIGDHASDVALDVLEAVVAANPPWDRRPRLEHLEVVSDATPARMAALGVTASVQPVHSDPAIQPNWRAQLGDERIERGYPWPQFSRAGALVAFGTDAPTAPHEALTNLYIATTRKSVIDPSLPANTPHSVVPLDAALRHATIDSAASYAVDDRIGRVRDGYAADLVVLDRHPADPDGLLGNAVALTITGGRVVYRAGV